MKKKANIILNVALIILFAWFLLSFVEINAKNINANAQYSKWNAFVILFQQK